MTSNVYIEGQSCSVWVDERFKFDCSDESICVMTQRKQWSLVFNALVLSSIPEPGDEVSS
jgi:hypothetical protein